MPYIQDLELTQCQLAGCLRAADGLKPLDATLVDRVSAGETVPTGECPDCGAYAHTLTPDPLGHRPGKLLSDAFNGQPGGAPIECATCSTGVHGHAVMSLGGDRWRFVCLRRIGVEG